MVSACPDVLDHAMFRGVEAATLLGVSRMQLYRYVRAGRLRQHFSKVSSMPRYRGNQLKKLWREEMGA